MTIPRGLIQLWNTLPSTLGRGVGSKVSTEGSRRSGPSFAQTLKEGLDPRIKTTVILQVPHFESYEAGPNPGHGLLVQTFGSRIVTLVNALPSKKHKAISSDSAVLRPSWERVKGTEAENYLTENRETRHDPQASNPNAKPRWNLLHESKRIAFPVKPAGDGTILDAFKTFNRGHDFRSISFWGLPLIRLPELQLDSLATYALTGTSASQNCFGAVLTAFSTELGEDVPFLPSKEDRRVVYAHEVMMHFMNLACYMGVSPALYDHRNHGLATNWTAIDANRVIAEGEVRKAEDGSEEDAQKWWKGKCTNFFEALNLPELEGAELMASHKKGNPQPLIAGLPDAR